MATRLVMTFSRNFRFPEGFHQFSVQKFPNARYRRFSGQYQSPQLDFTAGHYLVQLGQVHACVIHHMP
jgi:hypothetical protein